jgi:hypothetical protein
MSLQNILLAHAGCPAVVNRSPAGVAPKARKFDGAAFGARRSDNEDFVEPSRAANRHREAAANTPCLALPGLGADLRPVAPGDANAFGRAAPSPADPQPAGA